MNRKFQLDINVYNPYTIIHKKGNKSCDHDYPEIPDKDEDEYGCWICTKCGMETYIEIYE